MSTTLFNSLMRSSTQYDEVKIKKSIIVLRRTHSLKVLEGRKNYIYQALAIIIVKNVNNFFNLVKDIPKENVIHCKDDIVVECYIILNKCIEKFNLDNPDWAFHFYFNKALSHGLFRFKNKHYRPGKFNVNYDDVSAYENRTFTKNESV